MYHRMFTVASMFKQMQDLCASFPVYITWPGWEWYGEVLHIQAIASKLSVNICGFSSVE